MVTLRILKIITFLLIVSIPIFLHLHKQPVRIWDEARLAVNAREMNKNGNLLVTYFEGKPDMWNTKPPLMIWLQVFFIKMIGLNELALRLPSATAALMTCILLVVFSIRYLKSDVVGMLAALVLVTANGYIDVHAARTGDYDALLTFFTTLFCLTLFLYKEKGEEKWLHLFFAGILLAVFAKSIQGLLFLPGILLYLLFQKGIKATLLKRAVFIDVVLCLIIIAGYYLLREHYNPGYLQAVWDNELGGRYFNELEENAQGSGFYTNRMLYYSLPYWIWMVPLGFLMGIFSKDQHLKKLVIYLSVVSVSYFIIISLAKTKLLWYLVPLFPLLSVLVAISIYKIFLAIRSKISDVKYKNIAGAIFLFAAFFVPYLKIGKKVYRPNEYLSDKGIYPISYVLQEAFHGKTTLNNYFISYNDYNGHLLFYVRELQDKGQRIDFKHPAVLNQGDIVVASETEVFNLIQSKYRFSILKEPAGAKIYLIK